MRVVAGTLRGRAIAVPPRGTRPTTDKVRGAVANALNSLDAIEDARVADLFAGSGAMGIELLSRGAAHCTFVEQAPGAVRVIRDNLRSLGVADRATVTQGDVLTVARSLSGIDIAIADPPYGFPAWDELLDRLHVGLLVAESAEPVTATAGWDVVRAKSYGHTHVSFLVRVP